MVLLQEFEAKWADLGLKIEGDRIPGFYGFVTQCNGQLWAWTHSYSPSGHKFFPVLNGWDEKRPFSTSLLRAKRNNQ